MKWLTLTILCLFALGCGMNAGDEGKSVGVRGLCAAMFMGAVASIVWVWSVT